MTAVHLPAMNGLLDRVRAEYGTTAILGFLALVVGVLSGVGLGMSLADSGRQDCLHTGGVWVVGTAGSQCISAGSLAGLLLNVTR